MSSIKQIEANQRNALLSTGPKTERGLGVSSKNARRHGLLSEEVVTDTEEYSELEEFAACLRKSFSPQSEFEHLLVERVISCAWRLKRLLKVESSLFRSKGDWNAYFHEPTPTSFESGRGEKILLLSRYETALERSLYRALDELRQTQAARNGFVS